MQFTCDFCTYANSIYLPRCELCGQARGASVKLSSSPASEPRRSVEITGSRPSKSEAEPAYMASQRLALATYAAQSSQTRSSFQPKISDSVGNKVPENKPSSSSTPRSYVRPNNFTPGAVGSRSLSEERKKDRGSEAERLQRDTLVAYQFEQQMCIVCSEKKSEAVCWRFPDCGHFACLECSHRGFSSNVKNSELPKCQTCNKKLGEHDLKKFYLKYIPFMSSRLPADKRDEIVQEAKSVLEKQTNQYLASAMNSMEDAVPCPGVDCKNYTFGKKGNIPEEVLCSECETEHCSVCTARPFHFNTPCGEVNRLRANYAAWIETGRQAFLMHMAASDQAYRRKLEEYNLGAERAQKERQRHAQIVEQFQADEAYKQANCKTCPSCFRVIQKLSGCDLMRCGTDYHGGNSQNGCTASFNWSSAPAYRAENVQVREIRFDMLKPEAVQHRWLEESGQPTECVLCFNPVIGAKFVCMNCPYLICCVQCEPISTRHPNRPLRHNDTHVFSIFTPTV